MDIQEAKKAVEAYAAGNGVTLAFDENGACTLPLDGERVLHLQFREEVGELDLLALLGTVPEELRASVFEGLLAANYYWKETLGATLSWQEDLEQVVLTYPIAVASVDEATLCGAVDRFTDLQAAWAERLKGEILEAEASAEIDEGEEMSDLELSSSDGEDSTESGAEIRFDA